MKSFLKSLAGYATCLLMCTIAYVVVAYFNNVVAVVITSVLLLIVGIIYLTFKKITRAIVALFLCLILCVSYIVVCSIDNDFSLFPFDYHGTDS